MLPSLANLVLETGVKRKLELECSVQTQLLSELNRRRKNTEEDLTLEFLFKPDGETVARFYLTFSFTGRGVTGFSLGQLDPTKEKTCVECLVKKEAVYVSSLFYDLNNEERDGCRFEFVKTTETTDGPIPVDNFEVDNFEVDRQRRLQSTINRKKGEGAILLGAVVEVAAGLGKKRIQLSDAAEFNDLHTAPYFALDVTDFLRMTRGFGQYFCQFEPT